MAHTATMAFRTVLRDSVDGKAIMGRGAS